MNISMYKTLIQKFTDKCMNLKIANYKKFYNVYNNTTTTTTTTITTTTTNHYYN